MGHLPGPGIYQTLGFTRIGEGSPGTHRGLEEMRRREKSQPEHTRSVVGWAASRLTHLPRERQLPHAALAAAALAALAPPVARGVARIGPLEGGVRERAVGARCPAMPWTPACTVSSMREPFASSRRPEGPIYQ